MGASVPSRYFVDLYRRQSDPWDFEHSEYEREKYRATLASLPRSRYGNACELGCSIGVFTQMLAPRCNALLAVDVSDEALGHARERCRAMPNVEFRRFDLLVDYPPGFFDLTTVCEIGYYFSQHALDGLRDNVVSRSLPGATVVLVHWTPTTPGHAVSAREVHDTFARDSRLNHHTGFDRERYRLDVFERRGCA